MFFGPTIIRHILLENPLHLIVSYKIRCHFLTVEFFYKHPFSKVDILGLFSYPTLDA